MAEIKAIHDFAVKWRNKFQAPSINDVDLSIYLMGDDCDALGFEMDCGYAFSEKYGKVSNNVEDFVKIINNVIDIPLLGSVIYSRWRYFTHWAYASEEIFAPENREWFILALNRLAQISGEDSIRFYGKLKKIRIVSNNICYGPKPVPDEEVEQHLTINSDGDVWFSGYNFGCDGEQYEEARNHNFKIEQNSVDRLFEAFSAYFAAGYDEFFVTDIGCWDMELTNTDGKIYKFSGSLCADFAYKGIDLSDLVRETVDMDDLFVFDGSVKPDIITKRRQSEYIFCSVVFDEGYKSYYYLTDDDSIEVGDHVIVPAGIDNHEAVVEVVKIEYFHEENAPLPLEKTKCIICKYTEESL